MVGEDWDTSPDDSGDGGRNSDRIMAPLSMDLIAALAVPAPGFGTHQAYRRLAKQGGAGALPMARRLMRNSRRQPRLRLGAIIASLRLKAAMRALRRLAHLWGDFPKTPCADRRNFERPANDFRPIDWDRRRLGDTSPGFLPRRGNAPSFSPRSSCVDNHGSLTDSELSSPAAVAFGWHYCSSATAGGIEGAATVGEDWETSSATPCAGGGVASEFWRPARWPTSPPWRYRPRVSVPRQKYRRLARRGVLGAIPVARRLMRNSPKQPRLIWRLLLRLCDCWR